MLKEISAAELKSAGINQLNRYCEDIRTEIFSTVSECGGHLSSNLGAVELTVALHRVFDFPRDKIVFDVGHQCYTHKLLSGRANHFHTLRKEGGISGFPKRSESEYDCYDTGHAGTAVSAALGLAKARDLSGEHHAVIALVGDGSFNNGLIYEALNSLRILNSHILIITNRKDSAMARLADSLLPVNAGIEVSVAATKSYMAQLLSLYLLAIYMAENSTKCNNSSLIKEIKKELLTLPSKLETILNDTKNIENIAKKYSSFKNFIFIARGINYPTALEGALKLKEISYINATGYPAGELKHGPIAMLDETMPVLAVLNKGIVYDKVLSNCEEAKARQAKLIGVTNFIDEKHKNLFDDTVIIPEIPDIVSPALNIVVLQLLAYHISEYLGKDVDQPRNLAKSVTVE